MKKSIKTNIIAVCTLSVISLLSINVSALDYQKTINVGFNVQDTLTVSLSSSNLIIDDLMPGTASDSNIITVNVLSNNPYGYTLTSTVGNETTYNNRNLTNTAATSSTPFASLDYGSSVASLTTDNTWGYSYSDQTVATPTWTAYSGLPLYSDTTNIATLKESSTTSAASGDNIQFKIAAKASDTQLAGEYKNVVNFAVVGSSKPKVYMQTMTADQCVTDSPTTAYDSRDEEEYKIQRLADGKCWMLENLNLAGGTALSADNTDVTDAYISSFTTSNNLTKSGNTIVLPASSTSGFSDNNYSYVYNTGNKTSNCADPGCYSYYSWDATTLGSGRTIATNNQNAQQSICPKGWRLPSTYDGSGTAAAAKDFRALMIGYGGSDSIQSYNSSTDPTGATMYSRIGPGTTPNFLLAGFYSHGSFVDGGSSGSYWSSTSYSSTDNARYLGFRSTIVNSASITSRNGGRSVRCLFSS